MSLTDDTGHAAGLARHRAEQAAAALPPLLIAAERVAATVAPGVHGRLRVGTGETFWQFRRYVTGDPANRIDWRQSAKTERVFVRENEWEAAQSVWLWRDLSPSMVYRSRLAEETKHERASLLLLAAASLLVRGGEHIALLGQNRIARAGRTALDRITLSLIREDDRGGEAIPLVRLPRYGQLVLLSDFLAPFAETEHAIRHYAAQGVRGHLLQVLDPAEEELPFRGRIRFEGLEGEGEYIASRAETLRGSYAARLRALRGSLTDLCSSIGWTFGHHRTDAQPQSALLALYSAFSEDLA